jgi:IclR family acetate operon transcriptional repressor|tara:strand:- start:2158 stop:2958 length:801 start_codon:yes stop_codon:yes gene_type:complete
MSIITYEIYEIGTRMKTIDKALKLLSYFTVIQPEIGLSELARMSNYDKAATRRFLVALQNHQFIEQNEDTRAYRLGIGFLIFAKIREATTPLESIIQSSLVRLMEVTNETAHASLMTNQNLSTIGISFPNRGMQAHLELGDVLPLHSTASGIAFQAFSNNSNINNPTHKSYIKGLKTDSTTLEDTRRRCYAVSTGIYCSETTGIAVPYFDATATPMGAIAVATPNSRLTEKMYETFSTALIRESKKITSSIGGQMPQSFILTNPVP